MGRGNVLELNRPLVPPPSLLLPAVAVDVSPRDVCSSGAARVSVKVDVDHLAGTSTRGFGVNSLTAAHGADEGAHIVIRFGGIVQARQLPLAPRERSAASTLQVGDDLDPPGGQVDRGEREEQQELHVSTTPRRQEWEGRRQRRAVPSFLAGLWRSGLRGRSRDRRCGCDLSVGRLSGRRVLRGLRRPFAVKEHMPRDGSSYLASTAFKFEWWRRASLPPPTPLFNFVKSEGPTSEVAFLVGTKARRTRDLTSSPTHRIGRAAEGTQGSCGWGFVVTVRHQSRYCALDGAPCTRSPARESCLAPTLAARSSPLGHSRAY